MSKNDVTDIRDMQRKKQLQMLLHPERYTDEQLAEMLDEANIPVPDIDAAWQRSEAELISPPPTGGVRGGHSRSLAIRGMTSPNPSCRRGIENRDASCRRGKYQVAAIIIGVLMLSGITYAAVHIVSNIESEPKVAITDRKPDVKKVKKTYGKEAAPTKQEPIIYNNVELQQIMQYIADGYGVKVEFKNEAARTLRFYLQWEADDTLQEIIDKINHFEKVHLTLTDETITIE